MYNTPLESYVELTKEEQQYCYYFIMDHRSGCFRIPDENGNLNYIPHDNQINIEFISQFMGQENYIYFTSNMRDHLYIYRIGQNLDFGDRLNKYLQALTGNRNVFFKHYPLLHKKEFFKISTDSLQDAKNRF